MTAVLRLVPHCAGLRNATSAVLPRLDVERYLVGCSAIGGVTAQSYGLLALVVERLGRKLAWSKEFVSGDGIESDGTATRVSWRRNRYAGVVGFWLDWRSTVPPSGCLVGG